MLYLAGLKVEGAGVGVRPWHIQNVWHSSFSLMGSVGSLFGAHLGSGRRSRVKPVPGRGENARFLTTWRGASLRARMDRAQIGDSNVRLHAEGPMLSSLQAAE